MIKYLLSIVFCFATVTASTQNIIAATYPFTTTTSEALEDMSTGTTQLIGAGADGGGTGSLQNFGFTFWYAGQPFSQYDVSEKGFVRLGGLVRKPGVVEEYSNTLTTLNVGAINQAPCIAPYWDHIRVGTNGKVHCKTIGAAPNRKLVIEWLNMQVPRGAVGLPGNATFQLWLSETSGAIEFVYGSGLQVNNASSGYSVGFNLTSSNYASITVATNAVGYGSNVNNTNTVAIAAGLKYKFTSPVPEPPTALTFNSVTGISMVLSWTQATGNLTRYAVYRSDDGGLTYQYNGPQSVTLSGSTTMYAANNLVPGTAYSWKIYAFSNGALSSPLDGSQGTLNGANITSNGTGGGNWSNTATWNTGIVPTNADNVTIKDGDLVTIDIAGTAYNLTVGEGVSGNLQFEAVTGRTLSILNDVEIKPGAVLNTAATGSVISHVLNVHHNLLNNGALDLAGATTGAGLWFVGSVNSVFTGTGAVNDIYRIGPSKLSMEQLVDVNLSNFSVNGLSANATAGFLLTGTGTLKISGNNAFSGTLTSTPSISLAPSFQLWLNNPNFTILGQSGNINLQGVLKISQGVFNAGAAINNSLFLAGGNSRLVIEGGVLNIAGKCSTSLAATYLQTGGTVNVCTVGNNTNEASFDMRSTGSSFTLSGGTLVLAQLNSNPTELQRKDYLVFPGSYVTTGGILRVGTGATTGNNFDFSFRLGGYLPATLLDNTTSGKSIIASSVLYSYGDILIDHPLSFVNLNGFSWSVYKGTVTNNGSIGGSSSNSKLIIAGTEPVIYTGSGTASFPVLEINNLHGLFIHPATVNNIVVSSLYLLSGNITNAHKLTLGTGGSSSCVVQIGGGSGSATTNAGYLDAAPTFNLGTAGQTIHYGSTFGSRNMGFEMNPARVLSSMTVESSGTLIFSAGNVQVTGTLTLFRGNINLNGDTLTLGNSTTAAGILSAPSTTASLYNGKFRRWIPVSGSVFLFPVGIATTRKSVIIYFSPLPTSGGTLTAEWISEPGGSNGLPLTQGSIPVNSTLPDGYWKISAGNGLTGGNYTASLTAGNVPGVNDPTKLVMVHRLDNAAPWILNGNFNGTGGTIASPILSRSQMSGFGEYGIGSPTASAPVTTSWNGNISTSWEDAGNWSNGVPGNITNASIPAGMPRYPVINVNTTVKSITAAPGSTLNVADGINITIIGK